MRAVLQRVSQASVTVGGTVTGQISQGLVVLLAVSSQDTSRDVDWMKRKVLKLRIFADEQGRLQRSLGDVGGQILVVSQFTLYGDCRKGNRPSYSRAAPAEQAKALYEQFVDELRMEGVCVETGLFQAMMEVALVNDGPVTLVVDSMSRV